MWLPHVSRKWAVRWWRCVVVWIRWYFEGCLNYRSTVRDSLRWFKGVLCWEISCTVNGGYFRRWKACVEATWCLGPWPHWLCYRWWIDSYGAVAQRCRGWGRDLNTTSEAIGSSCYTSHWRTPYRYTTTSIAKCIGSRICRDRSLRHGGRI